MAEPATPSPIEARYSSQTWINENNPQIPAHRTPRIVAFRSVKLDQRRLSLLAADFGVSSTDMEVARSEVENFIIDNFSRNIYLDPRLEGLFVRNPAAAPTGWRYGTLELEPVDYPILLLKDGSSIGEDGKRNPIKSRVASTNPFLSPFSASETKTTKPTSTFRTPKQDRLEIEGFEDMSSDEFASDVDEGQKQDYYLDRLSEALDSLNLRVEMVESITNRSTKAASETALKVKMVHESVGKAESKFSEHEDRPVSSFLRENLKELRGPSHVDTFNIDSDTKKLSQRGHPGQYTRDHAPTDAKETLEHPYPTKNPTLG